MIIIRRISTNDGPPVDSVVTFPADGTRIRRSPNESGRAGSRVHVLPPEERARPSERQSILLSLCIAGNPR